MNKMIFKSKKIILLMVFLIFSSTPIRAYSFEIPDKEIISPYGYFKLSDFILFLNKKMDFNPRDVFEGAIICVRTHELDLFFRKYHSKIKGRYVLITQSDNPSPGEFEKYLDDPKIIAWFGRNPSIADNNKFHAIPIGLNCLNYGKYKKNTPLYNKLKKNKIEKEYLLYLNVDTNKSKNKRQDVKHLFENESYCYNSPRKSFQEYLIDLKKSHFVLSPPGFGEDCFRTWESILMGAIPIVLSSNLNSLYADLPVLIVDSWDEINEEFLWQKLDEMNNKDYNMQKLQFSYWENKIKKRG